MTLLNEAWFDCCAFIKIILDAIGKVFVSYDIFMVAGTYLGPNYFINPFEVIFTCFLCLNVSILIMISNCA